MAEKPPPYPTQGGYPPQQASYPPAAEQQAQYPPYQAAYPPQQPGYQPGAYPAQTTTTIIQQPTAIAVAINFHESPVAMTCPNCRATIVTATSYTTGTLTWLACFGLCIIGCDAGCCFIPFCVDSLKDVVHMCPSCHTQVGVFRRM